MTNEEAIGNLTHAIRWNDMPKKEALDMAIKALEQQPCEDAISRQAVLEGLRTCYDTETKEYSDGSQWINYEDAVAEMENLPSVTPQPKTGHWIDMGDFEKCSACNGTHLKEFQNFYGKAIWVKTNYCHNCGAKMVEPQESEVQDASSN